MNEIELYGTLARRGSRWALPYVKRVIIDECHQGVVVRRGVAEERLGAGAYWVFGWETRVEVYDLREKIINVPGQEVLSRDNVGLKVSLVVRYSIADPGLLRSRAAFPLEQIYSSAQIALRAAVGGVEVAALLERRLEIAEQLRGAVSSDLGKIGVSIATVDIRDVMFPGELKKIFAEVVRAQKEGQAALERARGESAALRNLANAARILEAHPALMNLRTLQTISETEGRGHTFVLGLPAGLMHSGKGGGAGD